MKILFLSKFSYPHIGGVEKHLEKISRGLVKKNYQVSIVTLKHDPKLPSLEINRGVKITRLPYSNNKFTIWENLWHKRSLIVQADIVHCHDIFFWYLPFRFLYPFKPVFTTFHGWEGKFPIPFKNIFVRRLSQKLSHGTISVGKYIQKYYGTKSDLVTYGAVDLGIKSRSCRTKQLNQCIFIGRLEKDLGLDMYLEAFKIIKQKYGYKFTFVGDGSYRSQAEKLGLVTGFVKNISPYVKKTAYIFSSSYLTILETMINKRPVFALYHNQLKKDYLNMFPGAKYIKISGSSRELIRQFNKAISHPHRTDKLITSAYHYAQQQTWDKLNQQYLNLWQK